MAEPETKTRTGGCHCGHVRYEVESDLAEVISCNCSICQKRGTLLTFVPEEKFRLLSGAEFLTDYQFNKNVIHHLFCSTCGTASFAKGEKPGGGAMVAVNIRTLDDIDLADVKPRAVDGRSF
jgi:hypothetical protein